MSLKYDLTAIKILKLFGYTKQVGKEKLEVFEQENKLKLSSCLFDFLSIVYDNPLLATADIWNEPYFSYKDIEERIEEDREYWEENPDEYVEDEYFQFSQIPKEQWNNHVENYLQIGSDYAAGVVVVGICKKDLGQENPPVYMLHEADSIKDWKIIYNKLSDYLMSVILDALSCVNYNTAKNVLKKIGWNFYEYNSFEETKKYLLKNNINLSEMEKYNSFYNIDTVYFCGYDDEEQMLFIIKNEENSYQLFVISKENQQ